MRTPLPTLLRRGAGILWISGMISLVVGMQHLDAFLDLLDGTTAWAMRSRSSPWFLAGGASCIMLASLLAIPPRRSTTPPLSVPTEAS